jgi:peptide/nickel transport system ATP-binding protein
MTQEQGIILSVEDLTVRYRMPRRSLLEPTRWLTAVDRVSFTVRAGTSLAVVGESGSGKSSTARAVMALERPSAGRIRLFDQDLADLPAADLLRLRERFQMIFQDPYGSLDPRYSVERIVTEPILRVSREAARERAAQALADVGLSEHDLRKYPHQFSGGQRQRIAIARALVTRPALIVADEPVSALDVSVQAQVLNLMKDLQAEHGLAYLFISHDLAVVEYLCADIVVMFAGAVVESGRTLDVLRAPAHPYTRELIAAMPRLGRRRRGGAAVPAANPAAVPASIAPGAARGDPAPLETGRGASVRAADVAPAAVGCAYRARCPRAAALCAMAPVLRDLGDGRRVACHFER